MVRHLTWKLGILALSMGYRATAFNDSVKYCSYDTQPYISCSHVGTAYGLGPTVASTLESYLGDGFDRVICLENRDVVFEKLASCECDVGIGDFTDATFGLVEDVGVKPSEPYHPSAFGIIQRQVPTTGTIWGIFQPFTAGLWTLIAITPFFLALFMTFFSWAISKYKGTLFKFSVLPQYTLQNTMSFLNEPSHVEYMDWDGKSPFMLSLKFCLQSMLVSYAFLCLVVTSVYTAQLTENILKREIFQEQITFSDLVKQLPNLVVPSALETYFLTRYSRVTQTWVHNSTDSLLEQLDRMRNMEIDGIVAPIGSALWSVNTQNSDCSLNVNPNAYQLTPGQIFLYGACVTDEEVLLRNEIILGLGRRGVLESQAELKLGDYFVGNRPKPCIIQDSVVNIHEVAGGWLILSVAIALPLVFTVARYMYYLLKKCISVYGNVFNVGTPHGSFRNPFDIARAPAALEACEHMEPRVSLDSSHHRARAAYSSDIYSTTSPVETPTRCSCDTTGHRESMDEPLSARGSRDVRVDPRHLPRNTEGRDRLQYSVDLHRAALEACEHMEPRVSLDSSHHRARAAYSSGIYSTTSPVETPTHQEVSTPTRCSCDTIGHRESMDEPLSARGSRDVRIDPRHLPRYSRPPYDHQNTEGRDRLGSVDLHRARSEPALTDRTSSSGDISNGSDMIIMRDEGDGYNTS